MKNLIHTALVTLFAASAVHAQEAVQWKVSDGGNGHWYRLVAASGGLTWLEARAFAIGVGGDLATPSSATEDQFVQTIIGGAICGGPSLQAGPYIGGFQDLSAPEYSEPSGGWRWVDGSPFPGGATVDLDNDLGDQRFLQYISVQAGCQGPFRLDDVGLQSQNRSYIIEWSTDCNSDGIVDYSQCHDGTLPDYNSNNIPDCCERGEACTIGSYPVQWRVEDGGNGHWYQIREMGLISWSQSRAAAQQLGGYLTTLTTASESAFVARLKFTNRGVNLGGFQDRSSPEFSEPSGGWRWVTGEPWSYANWLAGEPNNAGAGEDFLMFAQTNVWEDKWADQDELCPRCEPHFFAVEWSADCNNDNIVDYGQILQGQLTDANTNGIPDICEIPTCHDIDLNLNGIVEGGDLGVLLAFWGPVSPAFPRADINKDGFVNGADLGLLLSFWGACP